MRATDDLERMFSMLSWLQQHNGISVAEAARAFGIHPDRLVDELLQLSMIGSSTEAIACGNYDYLIDFDQDEADQGRICIEVSEYVARPLALTQDQALSLIVALRSIEASVSDEARGHVVSARAKLEAMAGDAAGRVEVTVASGAPDVREVVLSAIEGGRRLQLTYDGVNRGLTTFPVVDPARVVVRQGAAYLQAWSLDRQDWRTYKVDRIPDAAALDVAADDHGRPPELAEHWFAGQQLASVVLDLAPRAHYLVEYDPVDEVTDSGDPDFPQRVRLPLTDAGFLTNRLLRLADAARVVEPAGAGEQAARVAAGALSAYAELGLLAPEPAEPDRPGRTVLG